MPQQLGGPIGKIPAVQALPKPNELLRLVGNGEGKWRYAVKS
jgi:hypothetical protein